MKNEKMWKNFSVVLSIVVVCLISIASSQIPLGATIMLPPGAANPQNLIAQWTGGDFEFPTHPFQPSFNNSNWFVRKNIIATRAQTVNERVFLALPRYRRGVPATLVRISTNPFTSTTTFTPFPSWSLQEEGNCKALQSVVDIVVDQHGILWALDTGVVNVLETPIRKCPPKVVAFNAANGKILKTFNLHGLTSFTAQLQHMVVDYTSDGSCFVYVTDVANRAIMILNVRKLIGFRVTLPRTVSSGFMRRGVLSIALMHRETPELYLTFLNSKNLYSIETEHLRSGKVVGHIKDLGSKPSRRMVILGTDNGSTMFFRNEDAPEIFQWDTRTPFVENNFTPVYRSPKHLVATHVLPDYKRNAMLILQSNFLDFLHNTMGDGAHQQLLVI